MKTKEQFRAQFPLQVKMDENILALLALDLIEELLQPRA